MAKMGRPAGSKNPWKKQEDGSYIRTIRAVQSSFGVAIPQEYREAMNLTLKEEVLVGYNGECIWIKKVMKGA